MSAEHKRDILVVLYVFFGYSLYTPINCLFAGEVVRALTLAVPSALILFAIKWLMWKAKGQLLYVGE